MILSICLSRPVLPFSLPLFTNCLPLLPRVIFDHYFQCGGVITCLFPQVPVLAHTNFSALLVREAWGIRKGVVF